VINYEPEPRSGNYPGFSLGLYMYLRQELQLVVTVRSLFGDQEIGEGGMVKNLGSYTALLSH